jgi:hypothetical protein
MAFNDIQAWREMMDAEEQEKIAYDKACAAAEARAALMDKKEFDDTESIQISPDGFDMRDCDSACVCLDDMEDDEIDFSAYGISEADLGVGPADRNYPTMKNIARDPLTRLPAALGRPASDADLAAQDVVQLMIEALKKLQKDKKAEDSIEEELEFEEDGCSFLGEDEESPEKVDDKIEQMSQNEDYPLTDADWEEITDEPSYEKKIEIIRSKVEDRWSSLSAEAKRQIRADIDSLRKELLQSKWSENRFREAVRLQDLTKTRELTPEEQEKFEHIIRFDLDDVQRGKL